MLPGSLVGWFQITTADKLTWTVICSGFSARWKKLFFVVFLSRDIVYYTSRTMRNWREDASVAFTCTCNSSLGREFSTFWKIQKANGLTSIVSLHLTFEIIITSGRSRPDVLKGCSEKEQKISSIFRGGVPRGRCCCLRGAVAPKFPPRIRHWSSLITHIFSNLIEKTPLPID